MTSPTYKLHESVRCTHGLRWHEPCTDCAKAARHAQQVQAANKLLDRCRDGAEVPERLITKALRMVGEIKHQYRAADAVAEMEAANE